MNQMDERFLYRFEYYDFLLETGERFLLIAFTERSSSIHIISARLATRKEREDYEQNAL